MKLLLSVLIILLGFLVSGVWFGTTVLIAKTRFGKMEYSHYFFPIISSILPLACILPFKRSWQTDWSRLSDIQMWGIIFLTAVAVNIFIFLFIRKPYTKQDKLHYFLALFEAGSMEIPMRLMMLNFTVILLELWKLPSWLSIYFTGIIWCLAIVVQAAAFGGRPKEAIVEIVASMLFSVGIGYVYFSTGLLLFPIAGHILERLIGTEMKKLVK